MTIRHSGVWFAPAMLAGSIAIGSPAAARDSGDPIRLAWLEGDVAGVATILSSDGRERLGFVEYTQSRHDDVLQLRRVARFEDGSSDEDQAEAQVGASLHSLRGRSTIRDPQGRAIVDLTIDVTGGHITGFVAAGDDRQRFDERVELPPGTYWGPLIFIVIKNFDENARDGRVTFRTVVPTPKPRVFDMELVRIGAETLARPGGTLATVHFALRPTVQRLVDPLLHLVVPETAFFVLPSRPPSLARFAGPRNYSGQTIRLE